MSPITVNETVDGQLLICSPAETEGGRGIFFKDNPLSFPTTRLLIQLSLSAFFNGLLQRLIFPLVHNTFIPQVLAGILLGPSALGSTSAFKDHIFPIGGIYITDTFAYFGVMLFLFVVGIKMDISIVKESGRRAFVIGTSAFFVPLILNFVLVRILQHSLIMETKMYKSLNWVASFQSMVSSHVILCLLYDLKLLNSELGRLAVSSSMIAGALSLLFSEIIFAGKRSVEENTKGVLVLIPLLVFAFVIFLIIVLRPSLLWMERNSTDEKSIKENYVFNVFIMILGCAMFGEIIGQHFVFGPMLLGVIVPHGPPLGSALVKKLDYFVSFILLPLYFVVSGSRLDFASLKSRNLFVILIMAFSSFLGKLLGTMLPCIFYEMSMDDALCLGLILSVQGINDCLLLENAIHCELIDQEILTAMISCIILFAATISPTIKTLYKPDKRYSVYRRRTVQHSEPNAEFGMLACLYHADQIPSIINLLDATYPNPQSPICIYVLHLLDLAGRGGPRLIDHHQRKSSSRSNESEHIIKALRSYHKENHGKVMVYPFTAVSPYATMHDDVCYLAMEKRVSIVVLPFHKAEAIHWSTEEARSMRSVNRNILKKAPCSVGILVEQGTVKARMLSANRLLSGNDMYNVGLVFLGGKDDREALALGNRMVKHPKVCITVLRFNYKDNLNRISREMQQDNRLITDFREANLKNKFFVYREEIVNDSVGVISCIRELGISMDLVIVGRRHDISSPLVQGLADWNEYPELGFIGDIVTSSDLSSHASVLILQQQTLPGESMLDSPRQLSGQGAATKINDNWNNLRIWPIP